MRKTWTLLAVLLAFAGCSFQMIPPASAVQVIHVPGTYPTIQSAIDAASPGDTILVDPGEYAEHLSITTPVSVIGKDRQNTVISAGGGPGITIAASNVLVSNFTVTNIQADRNAVEIHSSTNITVAQVDMMLAHGYPNVNGTSVLDSRVVKLQNNRITSGDLYGITVERSTSVTVEDNEVNDTLISIGLFESSTSLVMGNHLSGMDMCVRGSLVGCETGVDIEDGSKDNVIAYNNITSFTRSGVLLLDSFDNTLQENFIAKIELPGSGLFAAAIKLQNSSGNGIFLNDLINNPDYYAQGVFPSDRTGSIWNTYGNIGNYWGDYTGLDDGSNGRTAGDGIGDTNIPHNSNGILDYYPLMTRWNSTPRTPVSTLRALVLDDAGNAIAQARAISVEQPSGQQTLDSTSSGGRIIFFGISPGSYTLTASATGYNSSTKSVTLPPRSIIDENFTIQLTSPQPPPVAAWVIPLAAGSAVVAIVAVLVLRRRSGKRLPKRALKPDS